ncbi:heavy-metal-associated domain-containing protein [Gaetbulibacter sp. M235]|uniref:cation transporter n=1 Tax=Gaetbulibacter sp. M235 TaxID=3126510 RepID=UPI00374E2DC8
MKTTLYIQNLKCEYCEETILKKLSKLKHISNISIKRQFATLTFEYQTLEDLILVKKTLSKIGYPPFGERNNFLTKTKSFLHRLKVHNKN